MKNPIYLILGTPLLLLLFACSGNQQRTVDASPQNTVAEIIPITTANIRGHSALYNEGWYVITSSDRALDYAHEKSVVSSREALTAAAQDMASRNQDLASDIQSTWNLSKNVSVDTYQTGTRLTRNIFNTTSDITGKQFDFSQEQFQKSWQRFIKGNLYLGQRTETTRQNLQQQPGNYYKNLREDFSNIYSLTQNIQADYSNSIGSTWDHAFSSAKQEFNTAYEDSGQSSNTLGGLANIFRGYAKGLYQGFIKPSASTVARTADSGARGAAQVIFLPTATAISVTGRTVQAVGTTVYYSSKLGIEIISPTVEAGLLSGMAILSLGTTPITYVTGASIGAVNQVAFTAASPIAGATTGAVNTAVDTGKYVAFVSYDAVTGVSKVTLNQASAAVVLGYNALTALPAHIFMGTVDSAVFLAYDGPRLVIAYAKGEIKSDDNQTIRIDSLPVGTVIDLQALEKAGIDVKILSEDPAVINQILERLPNDLRE